MFIQTLSDLTLDWSKVRSDKLLCVNTALECILHCMPTSISVLRVCRKGALQSKNYITLEVGG